MKLHNIFWHLPLFVFLIPTFSPVANAQSWLWAVQNNSVGYPDNPNMIQAEDGKMLVLSFFHNTVILNQDTFPGSGNILLIQFNPNGSIANTRKIGVGLDIKSVIPSKDGSNHIYLAGLIHINNMSLDTLSIPPYSSGIQGFIAKIDTRGKLKWFKKLNGTKDTPISGLTTDSDGNIYFSGSLSGQLIYAGDTLISSGSAPDTYLANMDKNGQELWVRHITGHSSLSLVDINSSGQIFMSGLASATVQFDSITLQLNNPSGSQYYVASYNKNGQVQWVKPVKIKNYTSSLNLKVNQQTGSVLFSGTFSGDSLVADTSFLIPEPGGTDIFIVEYQPDGGLSWLGHISGEGDEYPGSIDIGPDGGIFLSGKFSREVSIADLQAFSTSVFSKMFVAKWDANKSSLWLGNSSGNGTQSISGMTVDNLGQIFSTGYANGNPAYLGPVTLTAPMSFFIARMDDSTYTPDGSERLVHGRIWGESDLNCVRDSGEWDLAQWVVIAEPGPYYAASRPDGTYTLRLDTGTYTIKQLVPPNVPYINESICPPTGNPYTLQIDTSVTDTSGFDFVYDYVEDYFCPNLSVEITNSRRRVCTANSTHINYCNTGNKEAQNVEIHVQYPPEVSLMSTSVPYTEVDSTYYILDIGLLLPNECGSIVLNELVDCDALTRIGASSCMEVWITPANTCTPTDTAWSQASLVIDGSCVAGDSVSFIIKNEGQGDMTDSTGFELFLNDTLVHTGNILLAAGDSVALSLHTEGRTAHLQVFQVPGHPFQNWVAKTVEACGATVGLPFITGFVNMFEQSDPGDISKVIFCEPLTGSYDPNDKLARPLGITEEAIILPDTRLNYTIRFQNTGNDTAFKVVLVDTLTQWADLASLQIDGGSHPYTFSLSGVGQPVLIFTFDPIVLPDSNVNEPASHGHISFSFNLTDSIPLETPIHNFADIYFDFNPPIRTNTVSHLVSDRIPVAAKSNLVEETCFFSQPSLKLVGTDSLESSLSADTYQWFVDGNPIADSTHTILIKQAGNYTVRLVRGRCAPVTSEAYLIHSTPIDQNYLMEGIRIYPNPSKGIFVMEMENAAASNSTIQLADLFGRIVWQREWGKLSGDKKKSLDLGKLAPGLYYLKVNDRLAAKLQIH